MLTRHFIAMRDRRILFKTNQQCQQEERVFCGRANYQKIMKLKQNQQGFTLLELLVVVAVMAVISGAAMMSMSGQEEHAGQGVAMHTMQTLENATTQFETINKVFPNNLESLLCADPAVTTTNGLVAENASTAFPHDEENNDNTVINNVAGTGDASALAATTVRLFGGLSDAAGIGGGVAASFANRIANVQLPAAAGQTLINGGITTLRFAAYNACDDLDTTTSTVETVTGIGDLPLDENGLIQMAFDDPNVTAGAAGFDVTIDQTAGFPAVLYEEPADLGRTDNDIIIILGIGNSSDLVAEDSAFIAKAPRDGNVGRDKFGHYSLALKIGEFQSAVTDFTDLTQTETITLGVSDNLGVTWLERPELVAVVDADGDYYETEIAEFAGLEDE